MKRRVAALTLFLCCPFLVSCHRVATTVSRASLREATKSLHFVPRHTYRYAVVVSLPVDERSSHQHEMIAGTDWTGCSGDLLPGPDLSTILQAELADQISMSHLFSHVSQGAPAAGSLVVRSEIHAFCARAVGFLYMRVAGLTSLKLTVDRDGKLLLERKFERVVTDTDAESSGSKLADVRHGMTVVLGDSAREVLRDVLDSLEHVAEGIV